MKYLITGSSGFVGAALVEYLALQRQQVVAVDRLSPPKHLKEALAEHVSNVRFFQVDLLDKAAMQDVVTSGNPDIVIHTAAVTASEARDRSDPHAIIDVNVGGVATVMQCCRNCGVGRIIIASSSAAYGQNVFQKNALVETILPDPITMYEITKSASERVALRLGSLYDVDVRVARLSTVYGPWERPTGVRDTLSPIVELCRLAFSGKHAIVERPGYRDWIYIRDVVRGIVALSQVKEESPYVFNVGPGADKVWPISAWAELLSQKFDAFSYHIAEEGEKANVFLHQKLDRAPFDIQRLKDYTGFEPRFDLVTSFHDYMDWLRQYPDALE